MHKGNLVQTGDGYYGIIVSVAERIVFLGNGCEEIMDDEAWSRLKPLPINVFNENGPGSNFVDLIENRAPCQTIEESDFGRG